MAMIAVGDPSMKKTAIAVILVACVFFCLTAAAKISSANRAISSSTQESMSGTCIQLTNQHLDFGYEQMICRI
jgi:hypothetical protein